MIEFLFLDLDDTILDFHKAEHLAIAKTFRSFGLDPTQAVLDRYSQINKEHWQMLERKELTREQVLVQRFAALFAEQGLAADAKAVAAQYETNLSIGHYFLPGAEKALARLSKKYKLYLASNGTASVQKGRMIFQEQAFLRRNIQLLTSGRNILSMTGGDDQKIHIG